MSGVWERLVRSVRKAMNAVLSKPGAAIPLETLRTVFAEVKSILNSRPISPASDDPSDMEPLTPNHLLLQRRKLAIPPRCLRQGRAVLTQAVETCAILCLLFLVAMGSTVRAHFTATPQVATK